MAPYGWIVSAFGLLAIGCATVWGGVNGNPQYYLGLVPLGLLNFVGTRAALASIVPCYGLLMHHDGHGGAA
jgi:hypothetical protein